MQAGKYSYVDNAKYISDAIPSLAAFLQNSINELVKYLLALTQVELDVLSIIDFTLSKRCIVMMIIIYNYIGNKC